MKPTVLLLIAAVTVVGATGAVAAAGSPADHGGPESPGGQSGPEAPGPWPGNETTTGNDSDGDSPGQRLAGAVGAQGASVEGELWNRTLSDRLSNATTPAERAEVVASEVETLEAYLEALEGVRENLTGEWTRAEISEGEYRTSLAALVVRARLVELRANRTARAAADLPAVLRERENVNETRVRDLETRARDLYRFEGEIGQEVVNETLTNRDARRWLPGTDEGSKSSDR